MAIKKGTNMLDISGVYVLNSELEVIESQDRTCLLPSELSEVFVLNTIESEIWKCDIRCFVVGKDKYGKQNRDNFCK